jgi:toxin-antitoxin system PIN domain toxin
MILPDVNVLIYAFRSDSIHHSTCKTWLDEIVARDEPFGISPVALSAVARITTNPRTYKQPSRFVEVFAYCDNLLNQPHCEQVQPGPRHWTLFKRLCLETGISGPLVTDAWFAALAIEHGCTWVTYDRDYARFAGLDWKQPAA